MTDTAKKGHSTDQIIADDITLTDKLLGLEHLGFCLKKTKTVDGLYQLQRNLTTNKAVVVYTQNSKAIDAFIETLSLRTYNVLQADQDIIEYHLTVHTDRLGKDLFEELCEESSNLSRFKAYADFLDFILRKKRSKKSKEERKALQEIVQQCDQEIGLFKKMVDAIVNLFSEDG